MKKESRTEDTEGNGGHGVGVDDARGKFQGQNHRRSATRRGPDTNTFPTNLTKDLRVLRSLRVLRATPFLHLNCVTSKLQGKAATLYLLDLHEATSGGEMDPGGVDRWGMAGVTIGR